MVITLIFFVVDAAAVELSVVSVEKEALSVGNRDTGGWLGEGVVISLVPTGLTEVMRCRVSVL